MQTTLAIHPHVEHAHVHGPGCGHLAIRHEGHTDYLHDGHLHSPHDGHYDEHVIAVSVENPTGCTKIRFKEHQHGPNWSMDACIIPTATTATTATTMGR